MLEGKRVVGLGRVCVDEYFRLDGDGARWDGRKWSVRQAGEVVGGSVPGMLEVVSAFGAECELMGTSNPDDAGGALLADHFAASPVTARLHPCGRTARSMVVVDADDALHLICSVTADEPDRYPADALAFDPAGVWVTLLDLRHLDAAIALAAACRDHGVPVFLDPGSSVWPGCDRERVLALYSNVDVVCADVAFFDWLGDAGGASPATLIRIDKDGVATAESGDVCIVVPPSDVPARGSTLGTGDCFRAGLIAGLLALAGTPHGVVHPTAAALEAALQLGSDLATWRKADPALFPAPPSPAQAREWLGRL